MSMRDVYRKIARKNGVSVQEVKREMQAAIDAAYTNPRPETMIQQHRVPRKGKIPTPDEFIRFSVEEALKRKG